MLEETTNESVLARKFFSWPFSNVKQTEKAKRLGKTYSQSLLQVTEVKLVSRSCPGKWSLLVLQVVLELCNLVQA